MARGLSLEERVCGGILGAVVGDALGVPFEGALRDSLAVEPIEGMTGGGPHGQPVGAWSDDSSLLLSLTDSLCSGYRPEAVGAAFLAWWREGRWTPYGLPFGYGATTAAAMQRMSVGTAAVSAGLSGEGANGNGSLMRTLPVALHFRHNRTEMLAAAHEVSAITHAHPRAMMCCGIYCLIVSYLLDGLERKTAIEEAIQHARRHYRGEPWEAEREHIQTVLSMKVGQLDRFQVRSGGYVVETLEAAIWSFLRGQGFRQTLLVAVNLGGDTDTVGCVAGGLAGVYYGRESIASDWIDRLARIEEIRRLCGSFYEAVRTRRA